MSECQDDSWYMMCAEMMLRVYWGMPSVFQGMSGVGEMLGECWEYAQCMPGDAWCVPGQCLVFARDAWGKGC